jgi:hypothetical protein
MLLGGMIAMGLLTANCSGAKLSGCGLSAAGFLNRDSALGSLHEECDVVHVLFTILPD